MVLVSGQVFSGLGQVFLVLVQVFKFIGQVFLVKDKYF